MLKHVEFTLSPYSLMQINYSQSWQLKHIVFFYYDSGSHTFSFQCIRNYKKEHASGYKEYVLDGKEHFSIYKGFKRKYVNSDVTGVLHHHCGTGAALLLYQIPLQTSIFK